MNLRFRVKREFMLDRLVITAMMIALEVVFSRLLSIQTPLVRIGLGFLPMSVVAVLYGPVFAGAAWGISDIFGAMLFPVGPYFYGFTVSAVLNGVIYGLLLHANHTRIWRFIAAVFAASAVVSIGLDTLWLTMIFESPAVVVLSSRLLRCAIMIPIQLFFMIGAARYFSDFIGRKNSIAIRKSQIRKQALRYYNGDFAAVRDRISPDITERLTAALEYRDAKTIFCYVGRKNEIDTSLIIERALADKKTVAVPLCGKNGVMTARKIDGMECLRKGRFGVLEPDADSETVSPLDIDIAVIPSLVCDRRGRRVGFGGGYYDRYLNKSRIKKIILCPADMYVKKVPREPFDIRGDMVITERINPV